MKSKIGDTGESNNPYPPAKIADKYMELFKAERAAAVNFYKTTEKKNDRDASTRAIDLLKVGSLYFIDMLVLQVDTPFHFYRHTCNLSRNSFSFL